MIDADLSPSAFLAYCQPNEVSPFTLHVRALGEDGRQTGGGPVGETLCGRWISDGWDTELPVTLDTLGLPMLADTVACPGCWPDAHAHLLAGSDLAAAGARPAAVLAVLAARLTQIDLLTSDPASGCHQSLPHDAKVPVGPIRAALHGGWWVRMADVIQAALAEMEKTRDRYRRAVLTTERDQLAEQVRAADVGPAADLVAELVRRADAATTAQAAAEAVAASANQYAREQAVNAERYRQLRSFVRRWLNHGAIPAEHEADVRALCQLEIS